MFAVILTAALIFVGAAWAASPDAAPVAPPVLELPIDCVLGDTCYIQNYVDRDATGNVADYSCAQRTYDGHKGTDFALLSLADMRAGVDVLASATGIVIGVRDGMRDVIFSAENAGEIGNRDCGNGVVLRHENGWETQYCHMRQGSIAVAKGATVFAGTRLGLVGLSGRTQFPHAHLSVRHNGVVIDPFAPSPATDTTCATGAPVDDVPLWRDTPPYTGGGLIRIGFSSAVPEYDAIKSGDAGRDSLTTRAPAFVLWGFAYGAQSGDSLRITIDGPQGQVIDHTSEIERNRAQYFRAAGRKRPAAGWPTGRYVGTVTLSRDGREIDQRRIETALP